MSSPLRAFGLCALLCACNQNPVVTPVRSFDRPSDVALTCTIFDPNAVDVTPAQGRGRYEPLDLAKCGPLPSDQVETLVDRMDPTGNTKYTPVLRALVANSARGEVALVDVPNGLLLDLDFKNPGFNFVPVGRLPESIRASQDGCMAVTANVDSCDLAVLDLTTLYNMAVVPNLPGQSRDYADHVVRRIELWAGRSRGDKGHRLEARPTAIEISPVTTHPGNDLGCSGAVYDAWVALPGCEAVVEVELRLDGSEDPIRPDIKRAIHVGRDGATILADPSQLTCPAECTAGTAPVTSTDPLSPVGPVPTSQAAPGTLALDVEQNPTTHRLVIGDLYGPRLDVIPLDPATGEPGTPRALTLDANALGVLRARVSPRTPAGKFIYAVARDGTVHVVDLDRELECETNPDPSEFDMVPPIDPAPDARRLGCFPLGDPSTPRRSGSALGPGIALPNGTPARDVAFVHLDTPVLPDTGIPFAANPNLLVGDYAWIVGSDGRANLVQIYDACPQPNDPTLPDGSYAPVCDLANAQRSRDAAFANFGSPYPLEVERLSHRLRNGARRFLQPNSTGDASGTPRLQDPANPVTVTVQGSPAKEGQGFRLPTLQAVMRTIADATSTALPPVAFALEVPDPVKARGEVWTLGWEAPIPGTQRTFGQVCGAGAADCPRGALVDPGAAFCARGVQAGDKLELLGCDTDSDCVYTQVCAHHPGAPFNVQSGLCLDAETEDAEVSRCSALLRAERRYRIVDARQGAVLPSGATSDVLDLAEIYEPEYPQETHTCTVDDDCSDVTVPDPSITFTRPPLPTTCLPDWDGQRRCLRACDPNATDQNAVCGAGYLCAETSTSTADQRDFRCMRAPRDVGLFTDCLTHLQRYRVRVGASFSVVGAVSGFVSDLEPDPVTRSCVQPPVSSELVRLGNPRIPIDAPLCPQQPDASLGIDAISWIPAPGPNVCRIGAADPMGADLLFHFQNAFLAFALQLPKNPTGYVPDEDTLVSFEVVGGGVPLGLTLGVTGQQSAQAPRSMVVAPDQQTVFVVDEGKGTASTALRGQLLRLVSAVQSVDPLFQVR